MAPSESQLRVLCVGNMYPPFHEGGYELVWQAAVEHLLSEGHDVRVLTTDHRAGELGTLEPGVHRELRWYWRDHAFPRLSLRERLRLERHNASALDRHLSEQRPDVVSWWAMGGMSLGLIEATRRAGYPAVAIACDNWTVYAPLVDGWTRLFDRVRPLAPLAERLTGLPTRVDLSRVDAWLFPSEATRDRALQDWNLESTTVCHQGVSRTRFSPAEPEPWHWRLLYVGRIDERKGVDLAVAALPALPPEATLTIAGTGDERYRADLGSLAESLDVAERVTFTSRPHDQLRELYAAADAVIFPVRWNEPWGLVPLEAMSVGRPVVATGLGGSAEYLRDGDNCLLFDPGDGPDPLVDRLRTLSDDEALRVRLRATGFSTADRFGESDFNHATEALLWSGAERGGGRSDE